MINLNFIYSEIFLCLAIMILLLIGVFKKNPTKTVLSIRINTNTWLLMFLITILKKGIKHAFLLTNIIHETTTSTNYLIYYILTFV